MNERVNKSKYHRWPVSRLYYFEVWLWCYCYHYYLLIWRCLSNYDVRYLCAHIESHWNDVFLWNWKNTGTLPHPSVRIFLRKRTVSADSRLICLKIYGNCLPTENLYTRKSEEIPAPYTVEATFAIIYLCLLFSAVLNFSMKYVSYDFVKILLSSILQITT